MQIQEVVMRIDATLPPTELVHPSGSLLAMVGLPGSGKSSIVRSLQNCLSCVVVSTDNVRSYLSQSPSYTADAMMSIYEICYQLIEGRLQQKQRVVFDASNYLAARRERLRQLTLPYGTPLAFCMVQASQSVIWDRLQERGRGQRHQDDFSQADWSVYKHMVETQEPIVMPHRVLDSTTTSPDRLAYELAAYWLTYETDANSNFNL